MSAGRFGVAFVISAAASAILPFLVTPVVIAATGRREAGMALGVPIGLIVGWLLFPLAGCGARTWIRNVVVRAGAR